MPDEIAASEFSSLFKNKQPLLDIRAHIEYKRGAFPNAYNLPLLNDIERKKVGICFKKAGRTAAIALGEELISGSIRRNRIEHWVNYLEKNPTAALYCFRGGLRSERAQKWLAKEGIKVPLIQGGYKALRRHCLNVLDQVNNQGKFIIIGGKTGCAKTHVLKNLKYSLDLEGRANHRGSAFGRRITAQPNQINFENQLAIDLIEMEFSQANKIFLEDESRAIGSLSIPFHLHRSMSESPLAIIEESLQYRIENILKDYIYSNLFEYKESAPTYYQDYFSEFLLSALTRIQRRLGKENYNSIRTIMILALKETDLEKSVAYHREWVELLLNGYYDPMYEYQLDKKSHRIVFRGNKVEFINWVQELDKAE